MERRLDHEIDYNKFWIVIPARGGSIGVPRKNLRRVANKPLIAYTIGTALALLPGSRVVVITDDEEIAEVTASLGANSIIEKVRTPSDETLDVKIHRNIQNLYQLGAKSDDYLVTIQPTSPLLSQKTLRAGLELAISAKGSVLSVVEDRHLRWHVREDGEISPLYTQRVNRQLLPMEFKETGAFVAATFQAIEQNKTRIIHPITLLKVPIEESLDIDSPEDLKIADYRLRRLKVLIRTDASPDLGMGHVYRALALAYGLSDEEVVIVTSSSKPLGRKFFDRSPIRNQQVESDKEFFSLVKSVAPHLIILDSLDNTSEFIKSLQYSSPHSKIVSFEDQGSGATQVDLCISEFVEPPVGSKALTGLENAILSPTFETLDRVAKVQQSVEKILILFGGTDPSDLAYKSLKALELISFKGQVTLTRAIGAREIKLGEFDLNIDVRTDVKNMAKLMAESDVALTSAGRTLIELATLGVPSICMAQNEKEMLHLHATQSNGTLMMGLGRTIPVEALASKIDLLINDFNLRAELHSSARSSLALRSNSLIISRILNHVNLA